MENFIKLKKRKIIIFLLLFFNQFLFNGYALNYKKTDLDKTQKNNIQRKFYTANNILLAEKTKDEINSITKEANKIEEFLEEIFDP